MLYLTQQFKSLSLVQFQVAEGICSKRGLEPAQSTQVSTETSK